MSVKLLTEHNLEFLSLKGDCTGPSESSLVKIPHCRKSHVAAHMYMYLCFTNWWHQTNRITTVTASWNKSCSFEMTLINDLYVASNANNARTTLAIQWFILGRAINCHGSRGWKGPTFSRGSKIFLGVKLFHGRGDFMIIPLKTYITFDFPSPSLWI